MDITKSKGNYITDSDGNIMLDVAGTELNPLGYNHDLFKAAINGKEYDFGQINGCASDSFASAGFAALVRETFGPITPRGMEGIVLVNSQNAVGAAV